MKNEPILLSKLDASRWLGIDRSTLSGYLRAGQIEPHSLVGDGVHAKINIVQAIKDLKLNLDEVYREDGRTRVRLSTRAPKWYGAHG
jgi:predicted site-specific integrase-resolvase